MPTTHQSKTIHQPINTVWQAVSDFHAMPWGSAVITDLEEVGHKNGHTVGAARVLNNAFYETLTDYDEPHHCLSYSIDDGPSPVSKEEVSNYIGTIKLSEQGDDTLVEWSSKWQSESEDAVEFCQDIYVGLLDGLEKSFH